MATSSATPAGGSPPLRRDPSRAVLGGVCAGIAERIDIDPLIVRVAFIAAALAGGVGVLAYAIAWLALPAAEGPAAPRRIPARGSVEVALGVALLMVSVLLVFRAVGVWFSDAIVWPVVLVAAGGALIWRQSTSSAAAEPERVAPPPAEKARERAAIVSRTGLG